MSTLVIERQDYGLPAIVSLDLFRRKGIILSTRVEVLTNPSSEIVFWLDTDGNHKGTATFSLSGHVSPQGRQREELSKRIADDLYKDCITLQKQAAYSPCSSITQAIHGLSLPSPELLGLIDNSSPSKADYLNKLRINCFNGAMVFLVINGFIQEGRGAASSNEMISAHMAALRNSIFNACDLLCSSNFKEVDKIRHVIKTVLENAA